MLLLLLLAAAGAAHAVDLSSSIPYGHCYPAAAATHRVPLDLLLAVTATESNWDANALSHANAHGLMQIQWPGTAKHLGVRRVSELYKPCRNVELGARYLRELLDRYGQSERLALAAYNYGPGRITRGKPIPRGANRYVARVREHRKRLRGNPHVLRLTAQARSEAGRPAPKAAGNRSVATSTAPRTLLTLTSRTTANRYVRLLSRRVTGVRFDVARANGGGYLLRASLTNASLSAADRVVLEAYGWRP